MKTTTMSKRKVLELVSKRLRQERVGEIALEVLDGEIVKRGDEWQLPVRPSAQPAKMHEYFDALVNVETDLFEKHGIHVWLIPTVPD